MDRSPCSSGGQVRHTARSIPDMRLTGTIQLCDIYLWSANCEEASSESGAFLSLIQVQRPCAFVLSTSSPIYHSRLARCPIRHHQYGEGQLRNPEPQLSYALCLSVFQHAFVGLGLQIVRGKDARVVRARRNFHDAAKSVCSPSRTVVGGD